MTFSSAERWTREIGHGRRDKGMWNSELIDRKVQTCAEKRDCFAKHQPGVAGYGWLQPGRNFLST